MKTIILIISSFIFVGSALANAKEVEINYKTGASLYIIILARELHKFSRFLQRAIA